VVFGFNAAIIVAVLNQYVKENFRNKENPYIWVLSFFGSQLVGLFITNPLFLLACALVTSRWLRFKKVFLARFFRESLYIFEDYKFAVQFANT
jgi:chromate transport protein ChrA